MLNRAARQSRLVSGSVATPEHEEKIIGKRVLPGTGGAGDTKRRGSRGMKTTVTDWLASPELKSAEAVNHNVIPTFTLDGDWQVLLLIISNFSVGKPEIFRKEWESQLFSGSCFANLNLTHISRAPLRWVCSKYPRIITDAREDEGDNLLGRFETNCGLRIAIFHRVIGSNPNGFEIDNLYLDMNGIIHPCCHPEDRNAPPNEDDMIRAIFNYIDHIFSICRPRKVLYMAIDGVAPRAKMNQQRARRFNSARDRSQTAEAMEKLKEEWRQAGLEVPEDLPEAWDSNVITPGTPFMARLSQCLHFYIALRLHHNPAWRSLKVVFSDAKCPGEGEHKIMAFIRLQRAQPGYDVNTVHCLYGMDADLIMLGLASHDPYFLIVREKIDFEAKKCQICGQNGHFAFECRGEAKTMLGAFDDQARTEKRKVAEFQFLHVNILREYLARDLYVEHVPHGYDFENAVDDFVFLCFFVGNDFLPHLPSLAIHEGAIDTLMAVWRNLLPTLGGYLTQNGAVNMRAVAPVLRAIGALEDQVFRNRSRLERNQRERERKRDVQERERERVKDGGDGDVVAAPAKPKFAHGDFALNFKKQQFGSSQPAQGVDLVRLGEEGWRARYFKVKMNLDLHDKEGAAALNYLFTEYAKGLNWVYRYYYRGCVSWDWYFPTHYAPFASCLLDTADLVVSFTPSQPFSPFAQLMGVLPASSAHCLPPACRALMQDPQSPIVDFYPKDFEIDLNGKRYTHQAVALLPFIDERRLLDALEAVLGTLTDEEKERNSRGHDYVFVHASHALANTLCSLYTDPVYDEDQTGEEVVPDEDEPLDSGGSFVAPPDFSMSLTAVPVANDAGLETVAANSFPEMCGADLAASRPPPPGAAVPAAGLSPTPTPAASAEDKRPMADPPSASAAAAAATDPSHTCPPAPALHSAGDSAATATPENWQANSSTDGSSSSSSSSNVQPDANASAAANLRNLLKRKLAQTNLDDPLPARQGSPSGSGTRAKRPKEARLVRRRKRGSTLSVDTREADSFTGKVVAYRSAVLPGSRLVSPLDGEALEDVCVLSAIYLNPPYVNHHSALLPGLVPPPQTLKCPQDFLPGPKYRQPSFGPGAGVRTFHQNQHNQHPGSGPRGVGQAGAPRDPRDPRDPYPPALPFIPRVYPPFPRAEPNFSEQHPARDYQAAFSGDKQLGGSLGFPGERGRPYAYGGGDPRYTQPASTYNPRGTGNSNGHRAGRPEDAGGEGSRVYFVPGGGVGRGASLLSSHAPVAPSRPGSMHANARGTIRGGDDFYARHSPRSAGGDRGSPHPHPFTGPGYPLPAPYSNYSRPPTLHKNEQPSSSGPGFESHPNVSRDPFAGVYDDRGGDGARDRRPVVGEGTAVGSLARSSAAGYGGPHSRAFPFTSAHPNHLREPPPPGAIAGQGAYSYPSMAPRASQANNQVNHNHAYPAMPRNNTGRQY